MEKTVYLVTGGAGFIGRNFIFHLLKKYDHEEIQVINYDKLTYAGNLTSLSGIDTDPRYIFFKGDISHQRQLSQIFKKFSPDYVINFAAESHVDRSILNPDVFISTNIKGVHNLLKLSLTYNVKKFLQISTDEVYGPVESNTFTKEVTPIAATNPYSASKACGDLLTNAYFHTYNLPINITRSSNNYGPFQFPEKLIPLAILNGLTGKNIPIYGDGLHTRDWTHVDDNCFGIDLVLHKGEPGEIYNIGANEERTTLQVVQLVISILGNLRPDLNLSEDLITFVTDRKGHDRRYALDSTKIRTELDWIPRRKFEDGLKDTIKWYLDNIKWLDSVIGKDYLKYCKKIYSV